MGLGERGSCSSGSDKTGLRLTAWTARLRLGHTPPLSLSLRDSGRRSGRPLLRRRARSRRLLSSVQSARAVLLPERFRGGCAFGSGSNPVSPARAPARWWRRRAKSTEAGGCSLAAIQRQDVASAQTLSPRGKARRRRQCGRGGEPGRGMRSAGRDGRNGRRSPGTRRRPIRRSRPRKRARPPASTPCAATTCSTPRPSRSSTRSPPWPPTCSTRRWRWSPCSTPSANGSRPASEPKPPRTPRAWAFCNHVVAGGPGGVLVVEDARRDPRFADNPLVTQDGGVRFYAGAPLTSPDGHGLGALA